MFKFSRINFLSRFTLLSLFFIIFLLIAACSSDSNDNAANRSVANEADFDSFDGGGQSEESASSDAVSGDAEEPRSDSDSKSISAIMPGTNIPQDPGGFSSDTGASALNQMLIYKANLTMEVEDYGDAQTEIRNLTHLSNGYILEFSENKTTHEKSGSFVLKVPAQGFNSYLAGLESIKAISIQKSVQGQDVTEEYFDLNARLKAKQVVEARLLDFMEKATRTDDLLSFSNELANVQEEIERFKGRIRYLDQNVDYSTVEIRVYEKMNDKASMNGEPQAFGERISSSLTDSMHYLSVFFQELIIFFAGAIPILLVIAIIALPVLYFVRKNRK